MTEEAQVSIQADSGTKNQWAKGFFYRQDGRKRIVIPKRLLMVGGVAFAILGVAIVIQGTPEPVTNDRRTSGIAAPESISTQAVTNIPAVVRPDTDVAPKAATAAAVKADGKSVERKKKFGGPQLVSRPRSGKIPPGSFLKATLLTGASNGPVRAEVTRGTHGQRRNSDRARRDLAGPRPIR